MLTRRNWLLRCSIIANLAVLVYIGTHIAVKSGPGDYGFDPAGGSRAPAGRQEPLSDPRPAPDARPAAPRTSDRPLDGEADRMRTFALNEGGALRSDPGPDPVPLPEAVPGDPGNADDDKGEKLDFRFLAGNASDAGANEAEEDEEPPKAAPAPEADETELLPAALERLRRLLGCHDRSFAPSTRQRGEFWVLYNFVRAEHGPLACHEAVTYTTHGDFTFMDNLVPLLEKWQAPVSLAIHAPGSDLAATVSTVRYLRDCGPGAHLVRRWTTFHVFFSTKHIPKQIPKMSKLLSELYDCALDPPYVANASSLYKTQKKLLYPVNVGRNVARDAALTHYVLASDVELYPSPFLVQRFLNMVARDPPRLRTAPPKVFPLSIFEVQRNQMVPMNKTQLVAMLRQNTAIPFHKKVCSGCHNVPKSKEWIQKNETQQLDVFHVGKRVGPFVHWEPIFIGTHSDPLYDERLSWEGKSDKMTQGYALCVLDYEFMILNNAFLVHRPGIKTLTRDDKRAQLAAKTNQLIRRIIFPELKVLYGARKGCAV